MPNKNMQNAEKFLKGVRDNNIILTDKNVNKQLSAFAFNDEEGKPAIGESTLKHVLEADGAEPSTPISFFTKAEYRPYLLATQLANVTKQRFIDPRTDALTQNLVFDEGIMPRSAGSIHRPSLVELSNSTPIEISTSPLVRDGRVGKWRPIPTTNFRYALGEEIARFRPEYVESDRGVFYKYAFGIDLSASVTRDDISVSALARWMDGVLLEVETQMFQDYYNAILRSDADKLETKDLEAGLSGDTYHMDSTAWRKLHRSFGSLHGMTDIFVDETQEDVVHRLPLRENGSQIVAPSNDFRDLRNRLADGTYAWSQFLREPKANTYVCVDRQSSVALFIVTGTEMVEREVRILPDVITIVFSITVGFEVIDERGVKVVNVTTTGE